MLSNIRIFENIQKERLEELAALGRVRRLPSQTKIFHEHNMENRWYLILEGRVSLYKRNYIGEKKGIFVLGRGDILGDSLFEEELLSTTAQALTQVEIFSISKKELHKVMKGESIFYENVLRYMERRIQRLYRQLKNMTGSVRVDKRLAAKLWKLSRDYGIEGKDGTRIDLPLSVTYLAELIGAKRETTSRQLGLLLQEGMICQRGNQILIPSREALREYIFKMDSKNSPKL